MTPPSPPPPPARDLRPLIGFLGGMAATLLVAIVVLLVKDDGSAPTTVAATTTTASTTTTVPALFEDHFDGTSPLTLVNPADGAFEVTADGRGKITAATGATCVTLYPGTYGDVELSFTIASDSMGTGTRFGVVVFTEMLGSTGHYVSVTLDPAFRTVNFNSYETGGFLATDEIPIPAEAGYDPVGTTAVTLRMQGGAIAATINGYPVTTWNGATAATSGAIGFILYPDAVGHTAIFDDLVVRAV